MQFHPCVKHRLVFLYSQVKTCLMFWSARGKQRVMSSPNSCVVVCVNVLGWGQVDVRSTQNSCVIVCVNVLGWGQMEVSRGENMGCFSWLSFILSIVMVPPFIRQDGTNYFCSQSTRMDPTFDNDPENPPCGTYGTLGSAFGSEADFPMGLSSQKANPFSAARSY